MNLIRCTLDKILQNTQILNAIFKIITLYIIRRLMYNVRRY